MNDADPKDMETLDQLNRFLIHNFQWIQQEGRLVNIATKGLFCKSVKLKKKSKAKKKILVYQVLKGSQPHLK